MGKKKKKEKKKKPQEKKEKKKKPEEKVDQISEYSLDSALSSAKTTETTLQTLLKGVSEGKGFVRPTKEGEVKVTPQLTHESKSKIAEAYVMEDIPLTQRTQDRRQPRTSLGPKAKEKATTPKISVGSKTAPQESKVEVSTPAKPQTIPEKTVKLPVEKQEAEELAKTPSTKQEPSFVKKESIYLKLTEFFESLLLSYNENYDRWEMSISNILGILRKMRKITKKNTDDLVVSINNVFEKIQANLEQFKVKRNEIEKVAEVDIESMSRKFKRVLGLLELQIKEYQLKRVTDDFVHELKYYL